MLFLSTAAAFVLQRLSEDWESFELAKKRLSHADFPFPFFHFDFLAESASAAKGWIWREKKFHGKKLAFAEGLG